MSKCKTCNGKGSMMATHGIGMSNQITMGIISRIPLPCPDCANVVWGGGELLKTLSDDDSEITSYDIEDI